MKKIIFFLIVFLPIRVYAANVLDNYYINIIIDGSQVHVRETFDVIESDHQYINRMLYNSNERNINSNINQYTIKNDGYQYINGSVVTGESYYIEYDIDYYNHGTNTYRYDIPTNTIINNISFKVEYLNSETWVHAPNYAVSVDNNIITGYINNNEDDAYFTVTSHYNKNINNSSNKSINNDSYIFNIIIIVNLLLLSIFIGNIYFHIKQKK